MPRKMKDSEEEWIGYIPEKWNLIPLKYISTYKKGKKPSNFVSSDTKGAKPYLTAEYLRKGKLTEHASELDNLVTAENGDILLLWDGANAGEFINGKEGILGSTFAKIEFNSNNNLEYFKYYLKAFEPYLKDVTIGMGIPHVNSSVINNTKFILPELLEQQKIANFLEQKVFQIDSIIENTKLSIQEIKNYKQALIIETVTKGLNPGIKMKDTGIDWIGQIPECWKCSKIKYITSISRGKFSHRPRNDERFYDGDYPFIQTGDVARANKYITSYSQTLNELGKEVSKEFPRGTLVMTIAANIGDIAVLDFDSYFPDSIIGFVPNENVYWNYLYYIFISMKDKFISTAIVSTQLNLNIERVKELFIPITMNKEEQRNIANYLDEKCLNIDSLIEKKQQLIREFELYKKSLIYEYVTGKKEVL